MEQYWPVALVQGPPDTDPTTGYCPSTTHLAPNHASSLDLHMTGQNTHYQYYRKHGTEEIISQAAPTTRLQGSMWGPNIHSFGNEQQWRHGADGSILEMRKEKSRDAARSRRGKENHEFYELAKMLPLPPAITSQLDKASIIRLTISYLKLRDFTTKGDPPWSTTSSSTLKALKGLRSRTPPCSPIDIFDVHQGTHILQSLDGFAFTLAADGRFLYISETVSIYLGLSQVEMAGSSVFEYVHQDDHQELADHLEITLTSSTNTSSSVSNLLSSSLGAPSASSPSSLASDEGQGSAGNTSSQMVGTMNPDVASSMSLGPKSLHKGYDRAFCIRMKSTLTKRGCHLKSTGYRVVLVLGHLRPLISGFQHHQNQRKTSPTLLGMVGLAIALPSPAVNELKLESDMFVSKINLDFRLAHCEGKVSDLLHYTPEELHGRSLYSLCHAQDVEVLRKTHQDLIKKGQVMSPYYRILNKNGGYVWMQTCATLICNSKSNDDQNVICVNYVLSGHLDDSIILDHHQLDPSIVKIDSASEYKTPSPGKTGCETPSTHSMDSPSMKPSTPCISVGGGRSPQHLDHHGSQDVHHPHPHESSHIPHDASLNHERSPITHMDQDGLMASEHPHLPHGAPLTPQLTPVSQMGGSLAPIVASEAETIKTETGSILTSLASSDPMDESVSRSHKLTSLKDYTPGHLQYTPMSSIHHSQLSPASNNRYSPISNTQLSPDGSQYSQLHKVDQHELEGSGVRHLEVAMTRHLPSEGDPGLSLAPNIGSGFSAIQWAGGQDHSSSHILRQICSAKRESVIKTSRDPQEYGSPPCSTPCSGSSTITSLPTSAPGILPVPSGYPGYHISPPSSVSPDRLKVPHCDPYSTDIYNTPVYPSNPVPPKNSYDTLRWYSA